MIGVIKEKCEGCGRILNFEDGAVKIVCVCGSTTEIKSFCQKKEYEEKKEIEKDLKVLEMSGQLWNEFIKLEIEHESETKEMEFFIHGVQGILATRIARKQNPKIFPIRG